MLEQKIGQGKNRRARTPDPHSPHSPHTKGKHTHAGVVLSGGGLIAAAAALAAGTQAYGSVIRYDNPAHGEAGHFEWAGPLGIAVYLDLAHPAESQPGSGVMATAVGQIISAGKGKLASMGGALQTGGGGYPENYFLIGVDAGELIPTLGTSSYPWAYTFYTGFPPETLLPEGSPTYLGVQFDLGGGYQYGWIGVVRSGLELEAFAWGYETEVGVAIEAGAAIPAPGTLALLAFGALAGRKRSRKDR